MRTGCLYYSVRLIILVRAAVEPLLQNTLMLKHLVQSGTNFELHSGLLQRQGVVGFHGGFR
jgi:hypothetical protein